MVIYKIFRSEEWADMQAQGETKGAPIDLADGYVHFSTAAQVQETAAKWFAGIDGLFLIACDTGTMGDDLKWEVSRGDDTFPHLYRTFKMSDVLWSKELPVAPADHGSSHTFPDLTKGEPT